MGIFTECPRCERFQREIDHLAGRLADMRVRAEAAEARVAALESELEDAGYEIKEAYERE